MKKLLATFSVILVFALSATAQERLTEGYLERGELKAARQVVEEHLSANPDNQELRLQLALVQVLQALEGYSQEMYRSGLRESLFGGMVPFLRLPVPENPNPKVATNESVRQAFQQLSEGLAEAQATMGETPDSWAGRVPIRVGRIRIDFDGDGVARPNEELWKVLAAINPSLGYDEAQTRKFGVHADAGDVRWLEGYCHLMRGMIDLGLSYDTKRLFDHTAQLFFINPETPFRFLVSTNQDTRDDVGFLRQIADAITFLHLLDLPLIDAHRMGSALTHFRDTIPLSRRSWACIQAETDNDYEWIPSPGQKSAIPGWYVNQEMLDHWMAFLKEADSILAGEILLPFWREVPESQGLNLNKVFTEPRDFDLVLWIQGPGVAPYLEKGNVTRTDFWRLLSQAFEGQFLGFALWFN